MVVTKAASGIGGAQDCLAAEEAMQKTGWVKLALRLTPWRQNLADLLRYLPVPKGS